MKGKENKGKISRNSGFALNFSRFLIDFLARRKMSGHFWREIFSDFEHVLAKFRAVLGDFLPVLRAKQDVLRKKHGVFF
jgi:hypothetical protein